MKIFFSIFAGIALSAALASSAAKAQSAIPDERPGAGAITGPSMGSDPPAPATSDSELRRRGGAADAPERQTAPTEDDQGTGVRGNENPGRSRPDSDKMGNEPGTTDDGPFSPAYPMR